MLFTLHAGLRVHRAPGLPGALLRVARALLGVARALSRGSPRALDVLGQTIDAKLGRIVSREGESVSVVIADCQPSSSAFSLQPILRDARLRRAPQDEVETSGASSPLMVRRRIAPSRTMRPDTITATNHPHAIALRSSRGMTVPSAQIQPLEEIASHVIQRSQPVSLRNVLNRVGIEEGIERRGRPGDGGQAIACRPAIDPSDVFDHQRVAQLVA
jgi:hypothetical protein